MTDGPLSFELKSSVMIARSKYVATLGWLLAVTCAQGQVPAGAPAAEGQKSSEAKKSSDYLRIIRDKDQDPIALETSVVSFQPGPAAKFQNVQVDLIGAVHVADADYFKKLNQLFVGYDALLYELVAPRDNNVPQNGKSRHPVGQMQQGMKSLLDLSFQLEEINYSAKNFVHADMSPEEFSRVMSERGESFLQIMFRMMGQAMAMQAAGRRSSDADLLLALFAPNRSLRLKRVMATQFEDLEGSMLALEGEKGSTLIGQRNKKALRVLRRELAAGKKRIGIFYGAGHMPDMAARLQADFDMKPDRTSIRWLKAWDMSQ